MLMLSYIAGNITHWYPITEELKHAPMCLAESGPLLSCPVAYCELPLLKGSRDTFRAGGVSHHHSALRRDVK